MSNIYQIKVTLKGSKPPIWRRLELDADHKLSDLHMIIQTAMGWMNAHLHQFVIDSQIYSPSGDWDPIGEPYEGVTISQLLPSVGDKMVYEYDFGDCWEHVVLLEKVLEPDQSVSYPRCTKGKMACPPEDCGGVWGYQELLMVMANPKHPEHKEMKEWLGGPWDAEYFDLHEVNEALLSEGFGTFSLFM